MKRQQLIFLSLIIVLSGCSLTNTFRVSSADELDEAVRSARQDYEMYQDWRGYEEERIEYLIGATKQEVEDEFGKPNGKRRNSKYYYKGESSIAEEEWIYKISNETLKYKISFFFKNDRVVGLAAH